LAKIAGNFACGFRGFLALSLCHPAHFPPFTSIVINLQGDGPNDVVRGLFKVMNVSEQRVNLSHLPPLFRECIANMLTHHLHQIIWLFASAGLFLSLFSGQTQLNGRDPEG